jgi:hypothetical protein
MSIEEKSVFYSVIGKLREQYPKKDINMVGGTNGDEFVTIQNEIKFNTNGFNLLYNLKRLCDCLEDELI